LVVGDRAGATNGNRSLSFGVGVYALFGSVKSLKIIPEGFVANGYCTIFPDHADVIASETVTTLDPPKCSLKRLELDNCSVVAISVKMVLHLHCLNLDFDCVIQ